jgi:5-hydroxyisourate hydrolase
MSAITTHVLDTSRGRPAAGIPVLLEHRQPDLTWKRIGSGETDADGRLRTLMPAEALLVGTYRLIFETKPYFAGLAVRAFYPSIAITFEAVAGETHYHVPLLLSPFGYSTYRGSQ